MNVAIFSVLGLAWLQLIGALPMVPRQILTFATVAVLAIVLATRNRHADPTDAAPTSAETYVELTGKQARGARRRARRPTPQRK